MLKTFLLTCFLLAAALATESDSNCNPDKCKRFLPDFDPSDIDDVLPTADRLMTMCPGIQLFLNCINNEITVCFNSDLTDLLTSENETVAAVSNVFVGSMGLFTELCDENTRIHKDYSENIECMREVVVNPVTGMLCMFEAQSLYGAYKSVNDIDEENKPAECMVVAHVIACASNEMLQKCGETARATLMEMIKRIKMLKYGFCTAKDLKELKSTYIEFLQLDEDRRSVYEQAFDLRKKK